MATQCERVRTLTPERNALGVKILEACECLRWWWRTGVISGTPPVTQIPTRTQVEDRVVTALLGDVAIGDDEKVEWPSILLRPAHAPSILGISGISGTHNSWLLPIRVNREGLLTYPIGCRERCILLSAIHAYGVSNVGAPQ